MGNYGIGSFAWSCMVVQDLREYREGGRNGRGVCLKLKMNSVEENVFVGRLRDHEELKEFELSR